jgi:hypothetical protein
MYTRGHKGPLRHFAWLSPITTLLDRHVVGVSSPTPASYSLRPNGCPILNQTVYSACTGFSNAGAIKTTLGQSPATAIDTIPSPLELYTLGRATGRGGPPPPAITDTGADPADVISGLSKYGVSGMPSTSTGDCTSANINAEPTLGLLEAASLFRLQGAYALDPTSAEFVQAARQALCLGYAINFAVFVDTAFENWTPAAGPVGAPDTSDPNGGGHDLYCDGYTTAADGTTLFRCVNSWGTGWGDGGYFTAGPAFYTPVDSDPNLGMSCVYVLQVSRIASDASSPQVAA